MKNRTGVHGWAALFLAVFCLSAASAGDFGGEVLANSDIIGLTRANMTPEVIIAKIHSTPNIFDLSTRSMIALKENGVPDEVIRAMMVAAERSSTRPVMDEGRFRTELENIATGSPDAKNAGLAWMVANREQSLPALRRTLADRRPEIRAAAMQALSRTGDRESLPSMRNLLADPSPLVRAATAQALSALGDASAVGAAERAVARQLAPLDGYARLLGYARLTQSAGALGKVLDTNPDPVSRGAAAWALGEIGRAGIDGRPALERALQSDADPAVRREAASAVAKLHDRESAALLQDVCRRDPEVRKTILAAMSEYPETAEFLVWVLNLGADQIAADELETARNSLARLTGQDFGLDGPRWSEWFAANRGRFGAAPSLASAAPAPTPAPAAPAQPARPAKPQVDVETWGIVANSAGIPMAPQVDQRRSPGSGPAFGPTPPPAYGGSPGGSFGGGIGLALPPDFAGSSGSGAVPAAPSPMDFAASSAGLTPGGGASSAGVPTSIPDLDLGAGAVAPSEGTVLRTWTSDPSRVPPPAGGGAGQAPGLTGRPSTPPPAATPSGFGTDGLSRQPEEGPEEGDIFAGPSAPAAPAARPTTASSLPSSSIVSPMPSAGAGQKEDVAEMMRGISLPMPPGGGGAGTVGSWDAAPSAPTGISAADSYAGGAVPAPAGIPAMPDAVVFAPPPGLGDLPDAAGPGPEMILAAPPSGGPSPSMSGGPVFVEPEPGQVVVGEALAGPGMTGEPVPGAASVYQAQPSPASAPPRAAVAPGWVPLSDPAPSGTAPTGAWVPLGGPEAGGSIPIPNDGWTSLGAPPAMPDVSDLPDVPIMPAMPAMPDGAVSMPPVPAAPPPPAAPPRGGDVFREPSVPLPPVRPEGTVLPTKGKDQPPMLGEGMFGK